MWLSLNSSAISVPSSSENHFVTTEESKENFEKFAFQANFSILVSAFKDDSRL